MWDSIYLSFAGKYNWPEKRMFSATSLCTNASFQNASAGLECEKGPVRNQKDKLIMTAMLLTVLMTIEQAGISKEFNGYNL